MLTGVATHLVIFLDEVGMSLERSSSFLDSFWVPFLSIGIGVRSFPI